MTRTEVALWAVCMVGGAAAWTLSTLYVMGWLT